VTAEETVEEVVRHQLAKALGGTRGMLEAAVPTIVFTLIFLLGHDLKRAVLWSVGSAVILLLIRLVQRSNPQFVINAFVGIGIGAFFAWRAARGGGDANDQALAYFLPGILINAGYAVVMVLSIVLRYPAMGFLVGSVAHHPMAWREDPAMVSLCSKLTWVMAIPLILRASVLGALYLAGRSGVIAPTSAVATLGITKLLLGWPLVVAGLFAMIWLLTRDKTPVTEMTAEVLDA